MGNRIKIRAQYLCYFKILSSVEQSGKNHTNWMKQTVLAWYFYSFPFFYWFFYNRKWVDHHCQYPVINWLKKSNRALKKAVIVQLIKMLMCYGSYPMNYKALRYTGIALSLKCLIWYFQFFVFKVKLYSQGKITMWEYFA